MKILCTLIVLAFPMAARAQRAATGSNSSPAITVRGAFFALSVADMAASTQWYRDKLGLRVIMQAPRTDATRSAATVLQGGGLTIELVQHDEAVPLRTALPAGRGALYLHGIFKVGFVVDDFDRTVSELRARGVDFAMGPFPKRPDQPANVVVRDNAGNMIQIFGR